MTPATKNDHQPIDIKAYGRDGCAYQLTSGTSEVRGGLAWITIREWHPGHPDQEEEEQEVCLMAKSDVDRMIDGLTGMRVELWGRRRPIIEALRADDI